LFYTSFVYQGCFQKDLEHVVTAGVIFFCLGYGCFVFVLSLAEKSFPPGLGSLFR
jgi:hypothetical protein